MKGPPAEVLPPDQLESFELVKAGRAIRLPKGCIGSMWKSILEHDKTSNPGKASKERCEMIRRPIGKTVSLDPEYTGEVD